MTQSLSDLAHTIIGGAIEVHRALGPGLLESTYKRCLELELQARHLRVVSEIEVPVIYRGVAVGTCYRLDLLVEDLIIVEVKSVEHLLPLHAAQTLTYLRLTAARKALLMNFNVSILTNGLKSFIK
jgi:GxxExxY protein